MLKIVNEEIKFTAPPAILRQAQDGRRVPDFGIFSLDLDTVTLRVGFLQGTFGLWTVLTLDIGLWFFKALVL